MVHRIQVFGPHSRNSVMAKEVLLQATEITDEKPDILLMIQKTEKFSGGIWGARRPKPRRTLVEVVQQLNKSIIFTNTNQLMERRCDGQRKISSYP